MAYTQPTRTSTRNIGRSLLWGMLVVSLLGMAAAAYLAFLHWSVYNRPGHVSFCAVSETVNCDTVSISRFSVFAGVPVAVWGVLFYLAMVILSVWGARRKAGSFPWASLSGLNIVALGVSAFLFYVCECIINSWCIMCISLYMINTAAGVLCLLALRRAGLSAVTAAGVPLAGIALGSAAFGGAFPGLATDHPVVAVSIALLVLLAIGLLVFRGGRGLRKVGALLRADFDGWFASRLWGIGLLSAGAVAVVAMLVVVPRLYPDRDRVIAGGTEDIEHGVTEEGHAWIGAALPEVVVVEFSDYECPFCGRAHEELREVVRANKDWLRLVHVHMPLDHKCNPALRGKRFHRHACACARAAICAQRQGRFWDMNDKLFLRRGGLGDSGLAVLAEAMGFEVEAFRTCLGSERTKRTIRRDLGTVARYRLKPATPTFLVEGKPVRGYKKRAWWDSTLRRLRRSGDNRPDAALHDKEAE